ncbi:MAG: molybdenum ABC transporter ATP-binding protein [Methylotenera sp.]|nr:molybdenum ABC transporter ATP-binding protein [Methylotenera sp.]
MIDIDLQRTHKNSLGDFSLDIKCMIEAPVVGLFGPSGAGKSTFLAMIAGLVKPDAGHLYLDDDCLFDSKRGIDMPIHQRRIGMVFQDSRLFPHLNVENNLKYGFKLLPEKSKRLGFKKIVTLLEIGHLLAQKPHQLSGGEKQRVALGRALLISPRMLLLDEPLASLDVRLKQQILPFLKRVKDDLNIPMVYVSHAIDEVLTLTSQVAIMEQGALLAYGKFSEIIHHERVLALAQTLGLENVLYAKILTQELGEAYLTALIGSQQLYIPFTPPSPHSILGNITVSIAASNIALSLNKVSGVTIQNQLACTVTAVEPVGNRVLVTVILEASTNHLIAEVTARSVQDLHIGIGSKLYCLIKTQSIYPLDRTLD